MFSKNAVAPSYARRWPTKVRDTLLTWGWHVYKAVKVRAFFAWLISLIEWVIHIVPFLLMLWTGAFWRGAVGGWRLSAAEDDEKRTVLRALLGSEEPPTP